MKIAKAEQRKEQEDSLLLDGLKKLMVQINEQNTGNLSKMVDALKTRKEESAGETQTAHVTKPAKRGRRKELKITENEWFSVWMLGRVKKRKRMETSQYQVLRNVVKEGGEDVMKNFGIRYRELKVEGTQKAGLWIRIFFCGFGSGSSWIQIYGSGSGFRSSSAKN